MDGMVISASAVFACRKYDVKPIGQNIIIAKKYFNDDDQTL
jgi:hypothetical protein